MSEETAQEETQEQEGTSTTHVEMDGETQKRFNRIYGNMKQYERVVQKMGKENKALLDRLDKLEASTHKKDVEAAVASLKRQKIQALEEGDAEAAVELDDQLARVRSIPDPGPTPQEEPSIDDIVSPEDQQIIYKWGNELNDDGGYRRPWAQAGHPHNAKAAAIGAAVLEDQSIVSQGTEAVLAEVDRLMGAQTGETAKRTSPVLTNDGSVSPKKESAKSLSADEKIIAKAMGVTPEAYLKSKLEDQNAK